MLKYNYLKNFKKPVVESTFAITQCTQPNLPNTSTKWDTIQAAFPTSIWNSKTTSIWMTGWWSCTGKKINTSSSMCIARKVLRTVVGSRLSDKPIVIHRTDLRFDLLHEHLGRREETEASSGSF